LFLNHDNLSLPVLKFPNGSKMLHCNLFLALSRLLIFCFCIAGTNSCTTEPRTGRIIKNADVIKTRVLLFASAKQPKFASPGISHFPTISNRSQCILNEVISAPDYYNNCVQMHNSCGGVEIMHRKAPSTGEGRA